MVKSSNAANHSYQATKSLFIKALLLSLMIGVPFPINLVFAESVSVATEGTSAEDSLPGEILPTKSGPPPLPSISPSLVAQPNQIRGLRIDRNNIEQFRTLIVPEQVALIRGGLLELDAADRINYIWRINDRWESLGHQDRGYSIGENDRLIWPDKSTRALEDGFPFGDAAKLEQLLVNSSDEKSELTDQARRELGAKLLWNLQANFWNSHYIHADIALLTFSVSAANRGADLQQRFDGTISRVYPSTLDPNDRTGQFFREMISLNKPEPLAGWRWLTFRFHGTDEDGVWLASPALNKSRQLTGANRSDPILRSGISPDDILGWSGKSELVEARFDQTLVALAPFANADLITAQIIEPAPVVSQAEITPIPAASVPSVATPESLPTSAAVCREISSVGVSQEGLSTKWNGVANKFSGGGPWIPALGVFVPRKLFRLELTPNDANSLYGRQVLYIDAASMLPVYKIVYDRTGKFWKFILTGYGLATEQSSSEKLPEIQKEGEVKKSEVQGAEGVAGLNRFIYPSYTVIFDLQQARTSAIDYLNFQVCNNLPNGVKLSDFDPARLVY